MKFALLPLSPVSLSLMRLSSAQLLGGLLAVAGVTRRRLS